MIGSPDIEALRREEAELQARLPRLSLSDPEARAEAREIRERLQEIVEAKADAARRALAAVEGRPPKRRRRLRRAA